MLKFHNKHKTARASSASTRPQADDALPWELDPHERIMILAPHPDDEVLAAGGVIATALKLRNQIRVVVVTNGDASYATALSQGSHFITRKNFQHQAVMRQQESLKALSSLGLNAHHIHFWGFPDRGLASLWNAPWDNGDPYRSSTTGYNSSIQALNSPVLHFTGANLDELFRNELLEFYPTTVIMPHPRDNHSDHSALAGFTLRAVRDYYYQAHLPSPKLLAYWIWQTDIPFLTGAQPDNLAHTYLEVDPAKIVDQRLRLSPEIREQKMYALRCYPSQKIPAGKIFHAVSKKTCEIFTVLQPTFEARNLAGA